jgi:hypothetical protein
MISIALFGTASPCNNIMCQILRNGSLLTQIHHYRRKLQSLYYASTHPFLRYMRHILIIFDKYDSIRYILSYIYDTTQRSLYEISRA